MRKGTYEVSFAMIAMYLQETLAAADDMQVPGQTRGSQGEPICPKETATHDPAAGARIVAHREYCRVKDLGDLLQRWKSCKYNV